MTNIKNDTTSSLGAEQHLLVATSGVSSLNAIGGGWGAVILDLEDNSLLELEDMSGAKIGATNNEMELTAAIRALLYLKGDNRPVTITSGSQYLIKGMNEWIHDWRLNLWRRADGKRVANKDLWVSLFEAASGLKVSWKWVPGDELPSENERASLLAKLAMNRFFI